MTSNAPNMRCAIPTCNSDHNSSQGISFHRLPEVRFLYTRWKKAFSEAGLRLEAGSVVCSKHFLDKDLFDTTSGRQVRSGALPIVNEVCRICFSMDCKLYSMTTSYTLNEAYEKLTGLSTADEEHLPRYMCRQCANSLMECDRFRSRSLRAHVMMLDVIRRHGAVTVELIQSVIKTPANSSPPQNVSNDNDFLLSGQLEEVYTLTDARGDTRLDDISIDENIDDVKSEIDYAIDLNAINGDDVTNDDVDEVKMEVDDLDTSDNGNACPSNVDEDIDVDVVTNAHYDAISQDDRSVCSSNDEEDVVVDDEVENDIKEYKISNEQFINKETNEPLVYPAALYEHTVGNVLKITLRDEPDYRSNEKVSNNYIHSFVFVGEDILEYLRSQAREQTSLPTRVTEEKNEDHQPPHDDGGPSIGEDILEDRSQAREQTSRPTRVTEEKTDFDLNNDGGGLFIGDVLRCDICSYHTVSDIQLLEHLKAHAADGTLMCDVCGYKATSKNALGRHIHVHPLRLLYSCEVCKRKFCNNNQLKAHTKTHLDVKLYSCDVCNKIFKTKIGLSQHVSRHLILKPFVCQICKKGFIEKSDLNSHLMIHFKKKPYTCNVCGKKFRQKRKLQSHLEIHTNEQSYSCTVCNKSFLIRASLTRHMKIHLGVKPYSCDVCNMAFGVKKSLTRHMTTHLGEKPFTCDTCGKSYRSKEYLQFHLKLHLSKGSCSDVCGKMLSLSSLRKHSLLHSGKKVFKVFTCVVCDRQFGHRSSLKYHMTLHEGKTLYPCHLCEKRFSSTFYREEHLSVHASQKSFICDVCGKMFSLKGSLRSHLSLHYDKLYSCPICKKQLSYKSTLKEHMRIHTGEKPYSCEICNKQFRQSNGLRYHLKIHTGSSQGFKMTLHSGKQKKSINR